MALVRYNSIHVRLASNVQDLGLSTHYITICAYDNFVIFSYKQLCQPLAQMMFFMTRVVSGNEFPSMSLSTEVSNM